MLVRPFGDRAVLIDLGGTEAEGPVPEPVDVAAWLRAAAEVGGPALVEVVPGAETVLLSVADPRHLGALAALIRGVVATPGPAGAGPAGGGPAGGGPAGSGGTAVVIDVVYDGADLAEVAGTSGLSEEEVVRRHAAGRYRAAFAGFAPGFVYLTGLDRRLWVPRRSDPRPSVPPGSVAVAEGYSAVYPGSTPGGWRLLGRTRLAMWEPRREPPALIRPGDEVRFVGRRPEEVVASGASTPPPTASLVVSARSRPVARLVGVTADPSRWSEEEGEPWALEVWAPGPLTTVQDGGRPGRAHLGIPPGGAADRASWALGNRLVGNPPDAAALEATADGPLLCLLGPRGRRRWVAVTGAPAAVTVGGRPVGVDVAIAVAVGEHIRIGAATEGLRTYLAVSGGVATDVVQGSRSTDVLSGLGPLPLAAGQLLALGEPPPGGPAVVDVAPVRRRSDPTVLRVRPGPRFDRLGTGGWAVLTGATWTVRSESNRVGVRLEGPALTLGKGPGLPEGLLTGAVQVPPSGEPIVFLADHPTTGGYPVVAVVVDADLDAAGQLRPGASVLLRDIGPSPRGGA